MQKSVLKSFLFRCLLFIVVVVALELIGYLGLWLNSRSVDWLSNKSYFHIKAMLTGNGNPDMLPRFLTLPYLGYVPYPGYKKHGIVQHNEDGYRGKKVPMEKNGKFRVLCLGGSTTYGFAVDSPSQSFPARLEVLLNNYITRDSSLSIKYNGAEVINAGFDAATSAEELQQYLFKYRYYHPDAVLVHSGINDAEVVSSTADKVQLDYTHYRRINFHLEPLAQPMRWLMHSNFISFLAIRLFYNEFSIPGNEFTQQYKQTYCQWTMVNMDTVLKNKQYEYYPFYQNTRSLYREIASDSAVLLTLPNILNKNDAHIRSSQSYVALSDLNIALSDSLCKEFHGIPIAFNFDSIKNASSWVDDCHLGSEGEMEKAKLIFPYFKDVLHQSFIKK